jgi:hypothetical protein
MVARSCWTSPELKEKKKRKEKKKKVSSKVSIISNKISENKLK